MDHAPLVRVLQRIRDLQRDLPGVLERQRAFGRLALDQLHHQRAIFDAVEGCDVGMIQRGQDLGLALEARHAAGIAGEGFRQSF